jgi:NAD+ diphosphatase
VLFMTLSGLSLSRSTSDRAAHLRADAELLDRLWADPATRVLRVGDGRAPVTEPDGRVVLALAAPGEVGPAREPVFLGVDDSGVAYVAVAETPGEDWAGLRDVGALLDDRDAGLLTEAVAVLNWHATHRHCPRCGTPTEPVQAGWARRCPADGSEHYPRTDPAVIMTVVDADDRVLLGHNPRWPQGRYSTLAGFVEPGESLEAAVRREAAEEAGVVVGEVTYLGSQPWPFPASLMLGFTAHATSPDITVDGVEITDARWFSREELTEAVRTGQVLLPPRVSIARRLVERWYGGELTDAREAWR